MMEHRRLPLYESERYQKLFQRFKLDCSKCSGLCCTALFFSDIDGFPYEKPASIPCRHLTNDFMCDAHADLEQNGWKGCRSYDCFGAGNYVTDILYQGKTWKDDASSKQDIFSVFLIVYQLHQMLFYLCIAAMLANQRSYRHQIARYINEIIALCNRSEDLKHLDIEELRGRINPLLKQAYIDVKPFTEKKKRFYHFNESLQNQKLCYEDFSMSYLIGSDLSGSDLYGTCFLGTDVRDVKVMDCDLSNCIYLTQGQLNTMIGNQQTRIPWFFTRPSNWK